MKRPKQRLGGDQLGVHIERALEQLTVYKDLADVPRHGAEVYLTLRRV